MTYTINSLRQRIFEPVYEVYEVFQDYFGEDFVDLQDIPNDNDIVAYIHSSELLSISPGTESFEMTQSQYDMVCSILYREQCPHILVRWPEVTVTNDNNHSVTIKELYAKIPLTCEGTIPRERHGFYLTRSSFTEAQFASGYIHSHAHPCRDTVPGFMQVCLGSGPLNETILELKNECNTLTWMLFCEELSRYATVESLRGGPYIKLETIGTRNLMYSYKDFDLNNRSIDKLDYVYTYRPQVYTVMKSFITWYLKNGHLSFNFHNGKFVCGMSFYDYIIDVSNAFIEWFNTTGDSDRVRRMYEHYILRSSVVSDGQFYDSNNIHRSRLEEFEGRFMFFFKGSPVAMHIETASDDNIVVTTILDKDIAMYVLYNILKVINYRYHNEHSKPAETGGEGTSSVNKVVKYV